MRNGRSARGNGRVAAGRRFARRVARRIASVLRPERIILFGSYAYGTPDRDSDIDLLVVGPSRRHWHDRLVRLYDWVPADRPFNVDFVHLTPREIRRRLKGFDPFLEEVLARGVVLHAAER